MGIKNTLLDLNNHLFEQLERLNDEELTEEELKKEISRTKAMTSVADKVIDNAKVVLDGHKTLLEYGRAEVKLPRELGFKEDEE